VINCACHPRNQATSMLGKAKGPGRPVKVSVPGGDGFRGCRDGAAAQGEDQLVGVADDAVQERAQRAEAGLVEVLGVLGALKYEAEGAQRQGFQ
jgi:hypothetical protein